MEQNMIGRHADLSVYRELFRSGDFIKVSVGTLLIPLFFLLPGMPVVPDFHLRLPDIALLLSIAVNGLPIIIEAGKGLIKKEINVDELVSIAIIACVINGNYLEGAVVSAIMVFGALIEEAVSDTARNAIRRLVETTPDTAVIEKDGREVGIDVKNVKTGDVLVLKAGDTIAVDGVIIDGVIAVDESSITGESVPVHKKAGDHVFAGGLCKDGFIRVRADRVGRDSTIGPIIRIVETAEQQKTRSGKIVDTYAAWFTPVILSIAVLAFLFTGDISRAITVLIVGCPCSFLLASPVTTVAAIGRAAKSGIMVKGGRYLENIADARAVFFDKTGTITTGAPEVVAVVPADGVSERDVLEMTAAVEMGSLHPLGAAIVKKASDLQIDIGQAVEIHTEAGKGISGRVSGRHIEISTSTTLDDNGYTNIDVLADGRRFGSISLTDRPRVAAAATVKALKALGIEKVAILSGDQHSPVKNTADAVGIDTYYASRKPEEKLEKIEGYKGGVVYIGDGINDAPALKAADAGIAMGIRGADVALETADIVLMNDRIEQLPFLIRLSRKMSGTIKTNIRLSFGVNLIAVFAGATGLLSPIGGAITHNIGAILVVALAASIRFMKEDRPDEACRVR
jgi:Cd2+/Zn2+-exporting ATPase